jgi:Fe-Mn family superoxide dismutase
MSRRAFIKTLAAAGTVAAVAGPASLASAAESFAAPALPYAENALEPYISERTISFHFGKHTAAYYRNTSKMVQGTPYAKMSLYDVALASAKKPADKGLFNNAAQAWNHTFYWEQFTAGRGVFAGKAAEAVASAFGGYEPFKQLILKAAGQQFGSGWVWLAEAAGKLTVVRTPNAANPQLDGMKPLFVIDVWEHAYYLDYQNRRRDHVAAVLDHLIDWSVVAKRMS